MQELNAVQLEEVNGGNPLWAAFKAGWELGRLIAK